MPDIEKPKRNHHNFTPVARAEEIRNILGMSESQFSTALGYASTTSYYGAKKEGRISATAALAAEALYLKHERDNAIAPSDKTLLMTIAGNRVTAVDISGSTRTMTIDGETYILVPR